MIDLKCIKTLLKVFFKGCGVDAIAMLVVVAALGYNQYVIKLIKSNPVSDDLFALSIDSCGIDAPPSAFISLIKKWEVALVEATTTKDELR